jgi:hypothetical protein
VTGECAEIDAKKNFADMIYGAARVMLSNPVSGLEIGIQQYAEDACRIHYRGRGEGMMGEP